MDMEMYFGLTQQPFSKETRMKHLFETQDLKQIQGRLKYLVKAKGIGVITGNPGTGKTAAVREYVKGLNPALYKVIYINMTSISVTEFFRQISSALGIDPGFRKSDIFAQVQEEMTRLVKEKRCCPLIIVDEAQFLKQDVLRDLVLLLNFEMDSLDNCIVLLNGLPSLNGLLRKKVNEALRQRIIVNYNAEGISREEAGKYILHVLDECGTNEPLFTEEAIEAAWRNSQKSLRQMNRLLLLGLQECANQELRQVTATHIAAASSEVDLS